MPSKREIFLSHVAQTSELALKLEVSHAQGMYIYDNTGKAYLDLNSGISVSSLGHCHPEVVKAIEHQAKTYMHTMVYGEHIQDPQLRFSEMLTDHLASDLEAIYFLNSGSEAVELGIKLSRRTTSRYKIIAARNAYHGSTIGAESLRSDLEFTRAFMPGVPGVFHIDFNSQEDLERIDRDTAAVIMEPVQAEAGIIPPMRDYLAKVKERCHRMGALFILDEMQTGFGRTGHLFAHKKYGVTPDLLLIGKAMGGGMPIGGVVGSGKIFSKLVKNPALGHITTFGGHPVTCAAAAAALKVLLDTKMYEQVEEKEMAIRHRLTHPIIKEIRSSGLMMGVELTKRKYLKHVVNRAFKKGALIDYFLFNNKSFRLAPPLIITYEEIEKGCSILLEAMDYALSRYKD